MPELPEVETIRRQLEPALVGRVVVDAWSFGTPKFAAAPDIIGARIDAVGRRGKYLISDLDDARQLVIHLGMTGVLRISTHENRTDPHLRANWTLDDGAVIEFSDTRRFGRIAVVPMGDYKSMATLNSIGPEPLSADFNAADFHRALSNSHRAIKTQLLSQKPVAGIGNIYADEALWRARVHPGSRTVTRPQATRLHAAIREVLAESISRRGTTLRDYRTFSGEHGENQNSLQVYGRCGEPCARCGYELRAFTLDARTTTYCGHCQKHKES